LIYADRLYFFTEYYITPALLELVRKENPDTAMFFEVTPFGQKQLDALSDIILPYSVGRDTGALIYTIAPENANFEQCR
jgi:hypothetical protein